MCFLHGVFLKVLRTRKVQKLDYLIGKLQVQDGIVQLLAGTWLPQAFEGVAPRAFNPLIEHPISGRHLTQQGQFCRNTLDSVLGMLAGERYSRISRHDKSKAQFHE